MKIKFLFVGQTQQDFVLTGMRKYAERLHHYIDFEIIEIPLKPYPKSFQEIQIRNLESELILKKVAKGDYLILLDDKGKEMTSTGMAQHFRNHMNKGQKSLCFVVGGAYGFSENLYQLKQEMWSLSKLTFTHQMVRLIFIEQVYRSFSILKNEHYHHE